MLEYRLIKIERKIPWINKVTSIEYSNDQTIDEIVDTLIPEKRYSESNKVKRKQ